MNLAIAGTAARVALRADQKASQDSMHYQTSPNGDKQCSKCQFFLAEPRRSSKRNLSHRRRLSSRRTDIAWPSRRSSSTFRANVGNGRVALLILDLYFIGLIVAAGRALRNDGPSPGRRDLRLYHPARADDRLRGEQPGGLAVFNGDQRKRLCQRLDGRTCRRSIWGELNYVRD